MNEEMESFTGVHLKNFNQEPINIRFRSILYKVKCRKTKEEKIILNHVSGSFYAGKLTAILGPSGAGKTSLLKTLAGIKKKNVTGQILINGQEISSEFQWQSSYIGQESAMLPSLTTKETLTFATELKLKKSLNKKEMSEKISEIVEMLGLQKTLNTRAGNLSGGELKRLSIGVELVTNPPIMFFDEPTSGLDSVSSCQVVSHLQTLAKNGHTIICVIHQPSSRLFNMFNDVLVVSDGNIIYGGPINDMVGYFESVGYTCPQYYNRADFALEIASQEIKRNSKLPISEKSKKINQEMDSLILDINETKALPYLNLPLDDQNEIGILDNNNTFKSTKSTYAASHIKQFRVLLRRSLLCAFRDLILTKIRILTHFLIGLIIGTIYYNIGNDASKITSNSSLLFFLIMFIFFANGMLTVITFPLEAAVFEREQQNHWYSVYAYVGSKLIADIPLQILCPTIVVLTTYYMSDQPMEYMRILMFWSICILFTIIAQVIGLITGVLFSIQIGVFLLPAVTIPIAIFSGFFLKFNEIPYYLKSFSYISYFGYTFEGLLLSIYDYDRPRLGCSIEFCFFRSPKKFLDEMSVKEGNFWTDVGFLAGFLVFLQISLIVALKFRVSKSS